jgi:hypothetical protein
MRRLLLLVPRPLLTILLFLGLALPTAAWPAQIILSADPGGNSCSVADPGPNQLVRVYVLLKYATGTTGVSFAAPVPANSGLQYITDLSSYTTVGGSQSGTNVAFGTCLTGTFLVMEMLFQRAVPGEACALYRIQPGGSILDCNFAETPLHSDDGVALNCQSNPVPIRNPLPADGAVDVPLTTALSWDDGYWVCNPPLASSGSGLVYFGTTTHPPYNEAATATHTVGPLAPATKYYWWVYGDNFIGSPLWSFTTTADVSVRATTWGAIKALYR